MQPPERTPTSAPRRRPRPTTALLAALLPALAGCAGPGLGWPDGPVESRATLEAYKDAYYRDLGDRIVAEVSFAELITEARRTRVVYLGDHHLDPALHDLHLRILLALHNTGTPLALGVECVGLADQPAVDAFLRQEIGMEELRGAVRSRWSGSWLDGPAVDSLYYRDLLRFARDAGLPVAALEPTPRLPLTERDFEIARNIDAALRDHPDRVLVVLVGHAHLLGQGDLRDRVGAPSVVVAARPSEALAHRLAFDPPATRFVRTDTGVLVPTRWTP